MVAFRIQQPPKQFPFSETTWKKAWTVVTLTDLGDHRTHLRIAGMGYPDNDEGRSMREFFERGNAWTLASLQQQFDAAAPAPTRAAHAADPLAPVSLDTVVKLPRAEVWSLLATAAGWKQFMGVDAVIDLRPGGRFEIHFDPNAPDGLRGSEGCTVQSFLPSRMLSYTWNAPVEFAHARGERTWVVAQLEELGPARTRVRIDHLGFADQARDNPEHRAEWEEVRAYFQQAWRKVLDALADQAL
jgi:uncharacterized protein YndB with AHSA1/START domain